MQCFLFGLGQIFGEERLVREEDGAPYTVQCHSLEGECLKISASEFIKKVLSNIDAVAVLKQNLNQKEQKIQYRKISGIYNSIWLHNNQQ